MTQKKCPKRLMTRFKIREEHYVAIVGWSRNCRQNWEEKNKEDHRMAEIKAGL